MEANNMQVGGSHYKSNFQHWDFVKLLGLQYLPGQITRYVARWRKKNGLEDLEKAAHYINKLIEEDTADRADALRLMENFCRVNELPEKERLIFNMIVNYKLGDFDRLTVALETVQELIAEVKAYRLGAGATTAPCDPLFKEDGDEWRR